MKRRRNSYHQKMDDAIDRISSFPDTMLDSILSFLSTKQALQTCILSKRWRNVWASVPVLDLNTEEFMFDPDGFYRTPERRDAAFRQFVSYVLDNREPLNVDSFRFICSSFRDDFGHCVQWLNSVPLLMPKLVHIESCTTPYLPDSLLHLESIENLQLVLQHPKYNIILQPKSINLPRLRFLRLGMVQLSDQFMTILFRGCPLLEDLVLEHCMLYPTEISSQTLKKLTIICCCGLDKVRISCPGLVSFAVNSNRYIVGLSVIDMPYLINADISGTHLSESSNLVLLSRCSNARHLTVLGRLTMFKSQLDYVFKSKIFDKLESLRIGGWDMSMEFDLVAYFLQHSSRLQELTLQLPRSEPWEEELEQEASSDEKMDCEESSDVVLLREYLDTVTIYSEGRNICDAMVDRLLKTLHSCVRTIGKIIVIPKV